MSDYNENTWEVKLYHGSALLGKIVTNHGLTIEQAAELLNVDLDEIEPGTDELIYDYEQLRLVCPGDEEDDDDKKITVKNNKYNLLSRTETISLYSNSVEKTDYLNDHPDMIACVYPQDDLIQYQIINPDDNPANIDNWDEDHIDDFDGLLKVEQ